MGAPLVLPQILGKGFDFGGDAMLDISDSEAIVFSFAHGRSSSLQMNPILVRRAVLEVINGCKFLCTWMSTVFQPTDPGTRLTDDDPLFGKVVAPLAVVCRLILVGG